MAIIPHEFFDSVVSIGVRISETEIAWTGTGFFIGRSSGQENKVYPFLISNKHVFRAKDTVVIRMKEKDKDELHEVDVPLRNVDGGVRYFIHDQDDIDIAVLPLAAKFIEENNLAFPCFDIDGNAMTSPELRENGADEGSIIYMLCCSLICVSLILAIHPILQIGIFDATFTNPMGYPSI